MYLKFNITTEEDTIMAWETVNYSCGHSERQQFYGKHTDRDRKREWMERGVCPDCYRAEKEQQRQQENERAASLTAEIGFAALTGSEKQISWAQSIRQKAYETMVATGKPHPTQGWKLMVDLINLETSAKWWIDNRTDSWSILFRKIGANYPAKLAELKEIGGAQ